ncbi:hypothetical protein CTAYLR_006569 [Chrysophaeum taylorii]|uniref:Sulfotransferase n=1 Tax=Chrysophaeum taylorii TaxID=2483200 RepID=A0AAD7XMU7_9STRA|nr:hypothetical protein CTAYLR_006569 [Chrysophaeum taylorii]
MYGEPRIVGLETCSAFRGAVKPHSRRWAPAGMFNCGTNTLLKLLRANCAFEGKGRHALWQAPWGKHNPVAWRGEHWAPQFRPPKWQPAVETIFPVMVVKDPLTWMKSMCRNPYEAHFKHTSRHRSQETCPSPVAETETTVRFQPTRPGHYESLAHLWGEWNAAYLNVSFPRLIVRFEDLLFDSERTVKLACECVGGTARAPFRQAEEATKDESAGHRGPVNDRDKALRLYADETERYAHYTANDLVFVRNALGPSGLLDLFHYGFDVELAPRSNLITSP